MTTVVYGPDEETARDQFARWAKTIVESGVVSDDSDVVLESIVPNETRSWEWTAICVRAGMAERAFEPSIQKTASALLALP